MIEYDLTRLTPAGPVSEHLGPVRIDTDGPWLIVSATGPAESYPRACYPSHAVVALEECPGGEKCAGSTTVR